MVNLNGFNASNVAPNVGFTPIPTGDYKMTITASEDKPTKAGTGSYLRLEFTVAEGEYAGRKVFANLNLNNPSAKAVEIAQGDLSAICRAVNVMAPRDSVELHNLPLICKVVVEARNDKPGEMTNNIKGYSAVGSQAAPPTSDMTATSDAPPWGSQQ